MSDSILNTEHPIPIPLELIENLIIPYSPIPWLRVSKKYNKIAINYVANDPHLLESPQFAVANATMKKNYAMLAALLEDKRYTKPHIITNSLNLCSEDKKATQIFIENCYDNLKVRDEVLSRAIDHNWIDVVDYMFSRKEEVTHSIYYFDKMSEAIFDRVILDPKLRCDEGWLEKLLMNTKIPEEKKMKILQLPNLNMQSTIIYFRTSTFFEAIITDQRVIESLDLQKFLWTTVIDYYTSPQNYIQTILEKNQLDPSIEFNLPLRLALEKKEFTGKNKEIAQMLLDDDRVTLTLEPLDKNVLVTIHRSHQPNPWDNSSSKETDAKIEFILNHPKFKREWYEPAMKYVKNLGET